jgi:flagellar protein FlgJ
MRESGIKSDLVESKTTDLYTEMLDAQYAQKMATTGKGMGFAEQIQRDMRAKGMIPTDPREAQENLVAGIPRTVPRALGGLNNQRVLNVSLPDNGARPLVTKVDSDEATREGGNPFAQRFSNSERAPHVTAFVNRMARPAQVANAVSGVNTSLIMAQAALETGWGREKLPTRSGADSHNIFGIKAGEYWQGPTTDVVTTEYVDGQAQKRVERFRVYGSDEESFCDYARLIGQNPRYRGVVNARTGEAAAMAIQQAGYATDPEYANKLISVMNNIDQLMPATKVASAQEVPFGASVW